MGLAMPEYAVEVFLRGERIRTVPIGQEGLSLGREESNGVTLADPKVSGRHARLLWRNQELVLRDLGSSLGTQISGRSIESASIQVGDEFQIGPYALRIVSGTGSRAFAPSGSEATGPHRSDRSEGVVPAQNTQTAQEFRGQIRSLLDMTRIVGITDLHAVLESLLEQAMLFMAARRGYLVLAHHGTLSPVIVRQGKDPGLDERFSRTVCEQAMVTRVPVFLTNRDDTSQLGQIMSLVEQPPAFVVAVPLISEASVLGVLYLEDDELTMSVLRERLPLLTEAALVGGSVLQAALERRQIVSARDRWRWLAQLTTEDLDMGRCCQSPAMKEVLGIIERAALEDVTVLITGESGTGKEVCARTTHNLSPRREGPFVAVNCGAIPRDLLEAEFFGHERGAFTGATQRKLGRLELAQEGTLLLDEIGDLPKDLQVKLLRVLETRTFERLGGTESIPWNARLVAATNRDLLEAGKKGEFREDLYYRINVVSIHLPPLRERQEDLEFLVGEILVLTNRRFRKRLYGVTPDALSALRSYAWPGNVRELRNVIERAFVLEQSGLISVSSLPFTRPSIAPIDEPAPPRGPVVGERILELAEFVRRQEREYIRLVLDQFGGNVTQTAHALGIDRSALHKKMRHLEIPAGTGRA